MLHVSQVFVKKNGWRTLLWRHRQVHRPLHPKTGGIIILHTRVSTLPKSLTYLLVDQEIRQPGTINDKVQQHTPLTPQLCSGSHLVRCCPQTLRLHVALQ